MKSHCFNCLRFFFFPWIASMLFCVSLPGLSAQEIAGNPKSEPVVEKVAKEDLPMLQARIADRYDRLEQIVARLAEISASTDPHRAKLLTEALAKSREKDVPLRFSSVVDMLNKGRLSSASRNQKELSSELQEILEILLKENRSSEIEKQKKWLRKQLKEINKIIRLQKGTKARTENGADTNDLAEDQAKITEKTDGVGDAIEAVLPTQNKGKPSDSKSGSPSKDGKPTGDNSENKKEDTKDGNKESEKDKGDSKDKGSKDKQDGKPSDSKPSKDSDSKPSDSKGDPKDSKGRPSAGEGKPGESGEAGDSSEQKNQEQEPLQKMKQKIREAQEKMKNAQMRLEQAKREGAVKEQEKALDDLEAAKAEIEKILRQLREEEMERTLALLEVRFKKMLDLQLQVYEGTLRLDRVPEGKRTHDEEIEAARLSRKELTIIHTADQALALLQAEGTSVAFPQAVEHMREDMQTVSVYLGQVKVGELTQGLEEDIIEALEEAITAIQKAQEDLEESKSEPGKPQPPGEPQDPPLVDKLAELKMIRALQNRVNRKTQRLYGMTDEGFTDNPDVIQAISRLGKRQNDVKQATRALFLEKNK